MHVFILGLAKDSCSLHVRVRMKIYRKTLIARLQVDEFESTPKRKCRKSPASLILSQNIVKS